MEAVQIVFLGHVVASAMRAKGDIASYRALESARYRPVRSDYLGLEVCNSMTE